jgi:NADH-quinone oxidoreductase subunit A
MLDVYDVELLTYIMMSLSLLLGLGISGLVILLSFLAAIHTPDAEKTSPYECGFEPFDDARNTFDVRFYVVAILFLIFDIEVVFLFPWTLNLDIIGVRAYLVGIFFLIILTVGFAYEWMRGALDPH